MSLLSFLDEDEDKQSCFSKIGREVSGWLKCFRQVSVPLSILFSICNAG